MVGRAGRRPSPGVGSQPQNRVSSLLLFPRLHSSHRSCRFSMSLDLPIGRGTTWSTSMRRSLLLAPQRAHRHSEAA